MMVSEYDYSRLRGQVSNLKLTSGHLNKEGASNDSSIEFQH